MEFTWNENTIEYFKELYKTNENEYFRKVIEFCKYECTLEDGETIEDLQVDLISKTSN
tara:strand:- start:325 stop:498 length:174 start_codon:yes stop_codon:yes gene_type:complete